MGCRTTIIPSSLTSRIGISENSHWTHVFSCLERNCFAHIQPVLIGSIWFHLLWTHYFVVQVNTIVWKKKNLTTFKFDLELLQFLDLQKKILSQVQVMSHGEPTPWHPKIRWGHMENQHLGIQGQVMAHGEPIPWHPKVRWWHTGNQHLGIISMSSHLICVCISLLQYPMGYLMFSFLFFSHVYMVLKHYAFSMLPFFLPEFLNQYHFCL